MESHWRRTAQRHVDNAGGMTIRDKLSGQKRIATLISVTGFALIVGGGLVNRGHMPMITAAFIGVAAIVGSGLFSFFAIRCPRCKGRIGDAINWRFGGGFEISEDIRCCPFCAVLLDSELEDRHV